MTGVICQPQGCDHKHDCSYCRCLTQECGCACAAKKGLAGASSKGGTHIGTFSGLKQNNHNKGYANENM